MYACTELEVRPKGAYTHTYTHTHTHTHSVELDLMPKGAVLVNVGRGPVVDEQV